MKEHITKEQWDEIKKEQKADIFIEKNGPWSDETGKVITRDSCRPSVCQMIEFLGDFDYIRKRDGLWYIGKMPTSSKDPGWEHASSTGEICDSLWEACKFKLKE